MQFVIPYEAIERFMIPVIQEKRGKRDSYPADIMLIENTFPIKPEDVSCIYEIV